MAEAYNPSIKEFKEHLIYNLGHLIAGIHCESLRDTRARLDGLYNEVNKYMAKTSHVRRELFATPPELPKGGLFTGQQAEESDQQTHENCGLIISNEVDLLPVKIESVDSPVYAPVYSPISDASTESAGVYLSHVLSDSEDSTQILSDPEDLSQQIATDTPINMMECNNPYISMLKNLANEWGFSLNQEDLAMDNIL